MSVLSWHLLVPLATLLSELAEVTGAAGYQEQYARDLGIKGSPVPLPGSQQPGGSSSPLSSLRMLAGSLMALLIRPCSKASMPPPTVRAPRSVL
jgi:hypothetical protein